MFKGILVLILLIVVVVLVLAVRQPDSFRIARTVTIKAPPERIFALINDFHSWSAWSPFEHLDPDMKRTFSGAPSGVGSVYEWDGKGKAGAGRMEITTATPTQQIVIKLDFLKPFEAHNQAEFTLKTQGDSTEVTWAMSGAMQFIAKVMGVFFNMDKMIGADFETGLANLKAAAEK